MRIPRNQPRTMRLNRIKTDARQVAKTSRLFDQALIRAEAVGDRRAVLLRATKRGDRGRVLQEMGIISETDLTREFGE